MVSRAAKAYLEGNPAENAPTKLLITILENIVKNPADAKFRRINIEKVVKKLGDGVQGVQLLEAVGFAHSTETHYEISAPDMGLLQKVVSVLRRQIGPDSLAALSPSEPQGVSGVSVEDEKAEADNSSDSAEPAESEPMQDESKAEPSTTPTTTEPKTKSEEVPFPMCYAQQKVVKKKPKPPRSFAERGTLENLID